MSSRPDRAVWLPLGLLLLAGVFLVVKTQNPLLENFAPVMALAFTGAVLLPKRFRLWAPLAVVMTADLTLTGLGLRDWTPFILLKWSLFAGASLLAFRFLTRPSVLNIAGGCLLCSVGFYLAMNTASWIGDPAYAKTFAAWIQANTTGVPGYPPSWLFLRNAIVSDQLFSLLLVFLFNREASWKGLPRISWTRLQTVPA